MRKPKPIKITYKYIEPKTPEEAKEQQERIDRVFDMIFEEVLKKLKNENKNK